MSDPRLSRLAQLWAQGLEASLAPSEETELRSLLDDADLAEAWMELQGSREEAPATALTPPARLRTAFQRQFKPWAYWGLRAGLPSAAVLLWLVWPKAPAPTASSVVEDEAPFEEVLPTRTSRPDLGPPPGADERQHLWVTRAQKALSVEVPVGKAGARVTAKIMDDLGHRVGTLEAPRAAGAGMVALSWDGRTEDGERAPAGRYKVLVYVDGALSETKELIIEKK